MVRSSRCRNAEAATPVTSARDAAADRRLAGAGAEDLALAYLHERGLALVTRNFHCRHGEIDLIMRDGETIVFVEVRLRRATSFASAAESIDRRKQARIVRAARYFLAGRAEMPCRFDCLLMDRLHADAITWINDAFAA